LDIICSLVTSIGRNRPVPRART
jgi:hypothetical protein